MLSSTQHRVTIIDGVIFFIVSLTAVEAFTALYQDRFLRLQTRLS